MSTVTVQSPQSLEGAPGTKGMMQFVVTLSQPAAQDVTVKYGTANSTSKNAAKAGADYQATSGTLTIKAGQLSGVINVNILGDALKETEEVFNLVLSKPLGAGFASGETLAAVGTITDDEPTILVHSSQPLSILGASQIEGKAGDTKSLQFVVTLSQAAAQDVTLDYATADNTSKNAAKAGADYQATSGTLTIKAGELSGVINVEVLGDALKETDETFNLVLSNPSGAGFTVGPVVTLVGTIWDDEALLV